MFSHITSGRGIVMPAKALCTLDVNLSREPILSFVKGLGDAEQRQILKSITERRNMLPWQKRSSTPIQTGSACMRISPPPGTAPSTPTSRWHTSMATTRSRSRS
jgi:hypothetical protein